MNVLDDIYNIIVHHSKSVGGDKRFIRHIHVVDAGYSDIAYHLIFPNGLPMRKRNGDITWEAGRDGAVQVGRMTQWQGAHVRGFNRHSLGLCLIGDFDKTEPTKKQIKSLIRMCAKLCNMYNLSPSKILGHKDVGNSTCPGDKMYALLPEIREEIQKKMDSSGFFSRLREIRRSR